MNYQIRKQYSVYLENRVGALAEICELISQESINLLAVCAIDTVEEAVLRIVAEDDAGALDVLKKAQFRVVETEILMIELANMPGATGHVVSALATAGVNIDYIYASAHPDAGKACLVLRTHHMDAAESILQQAS